MICTKCFTNSGWYKTEHEARLAWNTRAPILSAKGDGDDRQWIVYRPAGLLEGIQLTREPIPIFIRLAGCHFCADEVSGSPKGVQKFGEPACGDGHMVVRVMEKMGYQVIGTDIQRGDDFLTAPLMDCDWIITNPPFSQSRHSFSDAWNTKAVCTSTEKPVLARKRKRKPLFERCRQSGFYR